jgi:hypothetical protein
LQLGNIQIYFSKNHHPIFFHNASLSSTHFNGCLTDDKTLVSEQRRALQAEGREDGL